MPFSDGKLKYGGTGGYAFQIPKMEGKHTNPYHISTVSDSDTEIPYNWTPIPISHIIGPRRCVEAKGNVIPLPWAW